MTKNLQRVRAVKYDCRMYANRLWNDMAICAAGLTFGASVTHPSPLQRWPLTRGMYELWAQAVGRILHPRASLWAWGGTIRYLPPTTPLPEKYEGCETLYLLGMFFRNPEGFKQHAHTLREKFQTPARYKKELEGLLSRESDRVRIGVEIRKKPFTYFPEGDFLIPLERTEEIVSEYLRERGLAREQVTLVVASDEPVTHAFAGYETVRITDERLGFHALANTSVVIGTNSPTANLSAWLADAPHIVTSTAEIDWGYYRDQSAFFNNKYATLTQKIVRQPSPHIS